jgi:hypothetical protein
LLSKVDQVANATKTLAATTTTATEEEEEEVVVVMEVGGEEEDKEARSKAELVADGVDLTMRCLETDPTFRPTAAEIREHRFLRPGGWTGRQGWLRRSSQ